MWNSNNAKIEVSEVDMNEYDYIHPQKLKKNLPNNMKFQM